MAKYELKKSINTINHHHILQVSANMFTDRFAGKFGPFIALYP